MVTVDEAIRHLAPDIVQACDELERRIDAEIRRMQPAARARAWVDVRRDVDPRIIYATCRKYERAGWFVRSVNADHGGYDIELRLCPADELSIYPLG